MTEGICTTVTCPCHSLGSAFDRRILGLPDGATDSIIFPLLAGIGSRCVLAADGGFHSHDGRLDSWKALVAHAQMTMALHDAKSDWTGDHETYVSLATFACASGPELLRMLPERLALRLLALSSWRPESEVTRAFSGWYDARSTPLVLTALLAARAAHHLPNKGNALPLASRSARTLRVRLAERLRSALGPVPRWPAVLRYTLEQWNGTALASLTLSLSAMLDAVDTKHDDPHEATEPVSHLQDSPVTPDPNPPDYDSLIREASEAIDEAKQATAKAESEMLSRVQVVNAEAERRIRDSGIEADRKVQAIATRLSKSQARVEQLETELQHESIRAGKLEAEKHSLLLELDEYAEKLEGERALLPDAPQPPDCIFAGYRIMVFTGNEVAAARQAMRQAFIELGASDADTTCRLGNKAKAADAIARSDVLVVVDTSFLSHAASERIRERARAIGAWRYLGSHGSSSIARAAAGAFLAHRRSES